MLSDSTRKPRSRKAPDRTKKPCPEFPLAPHASGARQKNIRDKIHFFGRWAPRVNGKLVRIEGDDPDCWWKPALELYKEQADDLHAGRTPRVKGDGLTVADLCNRFLTAKQRQWEAGEISVRMFDEYKATTDRLVSTFGKVEQLQQAQVAHAPTRPLAKEDRARLGRFQEMKGRLHDGS